MKTLTIYVKFLNPMNSKSAVALTMESALLYTIPMKINKYVPFPINMLDTIVIGGNMLIRVLHHYFTFFTPLVSIVFFKFFKDFGFISNLHFDYFSFSKLC